MKTEKSNKLRGTVLFTVVAVMALLIIFLTGTLALATASSNRAHKSYSSSQASYTAKTAISGFTEAMTRDKNVAQTVVSLGVDSNPSVIHPEVRINSSPGGSADRTVGLIGYWDTNGKWQDNQITVEKISSDEYYYDLTVGSENYGKWVKVDLVKVTATARVGKEESTVTAYIKKKPESKNVDNPTVPTGIKGFNTCGDASFSNGGRFTGGLGIGLKEGVKHEYILHNACEVDTTLTFINGDVRAGTDGFNIDVHEPDTGERPVSETIIKGNFYVANGSSKPMVELNYQMHNDYRQQQIPYLYVDGVLSFGSQCTLVAASSAAYKQPYNIFVGTLWARANDYRVDSGDLYMMDEYTGDAVDVYEDTYVGQGGYYDQVKQQYIQYGPVENVAMGDNYLGNTSGSYLYKWTNSVYNKTKNQNETYGGSIYCNGRLHLSNINKIEGDVRVNGDCWIDGGVTVTGDVVVGGTLYVNNNLTARRVYCDNVVTSNGTGSAVNETFTVVDNILHIPDQLKKYGNNLTELSAYLVNFDRRNFFEWDPSAHRDSSGKMMLINGNEAGDAYVLYYYWKDEYAPGMKVYMHKETNDYKYIYADETFEDESYEYIGEVDDYLNGLLESESFLRDDVTTKIVEKFLDKPIYSSELPRVDGQIRTWYNVMPQYIGDDENGKPLFRSTSVKTDYEKGYYIVENNPEHEFITELPWYTLKSYTGADTEIRVNDAQTIYSDLEPHNIVDENYVRKAATPSADAHIEGNIYKYNAYGEPAYPVSMERDAIYTSDKKKTTKIVRTLTEVRQDMNLDNLDKAYPDDVPSDYKDEAEVVAWDSGTVMNATKADGTAYKWDNGKIVDSCTIKGDIKGKQITIDPQGQTIWVILDGVTMSGLGGVYSDIIVDLEQTDENGNKFEAGKVCFLIKGTLWLSDKNSIVNKKITTNNYAFDYTEDWGMEFYGTKGDADKGIAASVIRLDDSSTITGAFRCPYTDFACTKNGKWSVKYTDEYNVDWSKKGGGQTRGQDLTSGKPPIIGNALFHDVLQGEGLGMNEFGMYYTQCGQGGSAIGTQTNKTQVKTDVGIFDVLYFSGV